jgi:hypothetical protein
MTRGGKSSRGEGASCRAEEVGVWDDLQKSVSKCATENKKRMLHENSKLLTFSCLDPTATCGCASARRPCAAPRPDPCLCPALGRGLCPCNHACRGTGSDFCAYDCAYHGGHNRHRCHVDGFCGRLRHHCGWSGALLTVHRRPFDAGGTGKHLGESSLIQRAFAGKRFFLLANCRIATNFCTGSESGNGYYRAGISRGPHGQGASAHPTERRAPASGKLHTRLQCFVCRRAV